MKRLFVLLAALAALAAVIAGSAFAGGGNSGNAQACQQNGWQSLFRANGTGFVNQSECVQYGANGGTLYHGENFSEMQAWSAGASEGTTPAPNQPTTFSGGTIDSLFGATPVWWFPAGGVLAAGPYFNGFANGAHFLFTGLNVNTAKFTFSTPAKTVQVQAESDKSFVPVTLTLTGLDASGNPIPGATASVTQNASENNGATAATLNITSASANIKSFTVSVDDGGNNAGLGVSNILWS
jgi:hypothetical protein